MKKLLGLIAAIAATTLAFTLIGSTAQAANPHFAPPTTKIKYTDTPPNASVTVYYQAVGLGPQQAVTVKLSGVVSYGANCLKNGSTVTNWASREYHYHNRDYIADAQGALKGSDDLRSNAVCPGTATFQSWASLPCWLDLKAELFSGRGGQAISTYLFTADDGVQPCPRSA